MRTLTRMERKQFYEGMDIDELEFERDDLYNALRDERSYLKDSMSPGETELHLNRISELHLEIDLINALMQELMLEGS